MPSSTVLSASDFYVDRESIGGPCADRHPGTTPSAPWCTIAKANQSLVAGDTVTIRQGSYVESIAPARAGAEGSPIIYRNYEGESVVLSGVGTAINVVDSSYITITGIDVRQVDRYVTLDGSHHVQIGNGQFTDHNSQGGWPTGLVFRDNSHHNRLHDCTIGRVGYSTATDDKGGVMNVGIWDNADDHSDYNLIENNVLEYGGHHVLDISSNFNVIRNNYFHNENWMDCARSETDGRCGNRGIIFEYDPTNVTYNVVEGNRFGFSGVPPDQNTSTGLSVRTPHNIVRRNEFYYNDGPGMGISTLSGLWEASDNHVYHNVFYHNGYTALPGVEEWKQVGMLVAHHGTGAVIADLAIKNNIFHDNKAHGLWFYYVDPALHVMAGNWDESGPPGFQDIASPADPIDPALPDFRLRGDSLCIDQGVFLTQASASGSGVDIPVEDAGYFSDGRGIVPSDVVQLEGETFEAQIVSIDYAGNVLTLDRQVQFAQGQGVSLAYEGTGPDIGAHEFSESPAMATKTPIPTPTMGAPTITPVAADTPTPTLVRVRLYLPAAHSR